MMLGVVDEVDGHYIATRFAGLLIPLSSMYVVSSSSERSGNVTTTTWEGVEVKFNWKSAVLAYPRVYLPMLSLAWPFITHWGENVNDIPRSTWITAAALFVSAFLFLIPGRLSAREKSRLRVLRQATGMALDPSKLHDERRMGELFAMTDTLKRANLPSTYEGLAPLIEALPAAALPTVYAFSVYSADDPRWAELGARAYARIEAAGAA